MKPQIKIKRLHHFFMGASALYFTLAMNSYGQSQTINNETYVVIGAFSIEKNAQKLIEYAKEKNISADYQIHPTKDLFYVYEATENPKQEWQRIKDNYPEFYDVWIYTGKLGRIDEHISENSTVSKVDKSAHAGISDKLSESKSEITLAEKEGTSNDSQSAPIVKEQGVYQVYFNTYNSKNMKEVKGNVNVIDPVRAKQLINAKSHEIVQVKNPNNGLNSVKLSTEIFGFREVQQTINLDNPVNDTTSNFVHMVGDSIIVDFELERFKKGDVLVMYNVYFFKDAAIMRPESIYELNSLLDMLKENENLVVKLHGHTNGNSHGKILHLDLEDKNFFSLNATHKEDVGSAKKLSLYRAYTIQHWLIEQGIAEERMEIKGWGGKKMMYDKHDTQAYKNVRVEVEIIEE